MKKTIMKVQKKTGFNSLASNFFPSYPPSIKPVKGKLTNSFLLKIANLFKF